MKETPIYILLCILFLSLQTNAQELSEASLAKQKQIDNYFLSLYNDNQFNGTVAVIEQGNMLYHRALGWENYQSKDTLDIHSSFRLASVSKQFTATAILMLMEKGLLSVEDDITTYLPELPYEGVKIKNLLQHNSGIPDYFALDYLIKARFPKKIINNEDMLLYFWEMKPSLEFQPGKKSSYSNTGYVFLALIIERVSGLCYEDFLQQNIFNPLDMQDTFVYDTYNLEQVVTKDTIYKIDTVTNVPQFIRIRETTQVETILETRPRKRAWGYIISWDNSWDNMDYDPFDGVAGEKSVASSTYDLAKWDAALHTEKLLPNNTLQEAFTHNGMTVRDYGFGYGWKVYTKRKHIVFHHGLYRGFRTFIQRNLQDKTTIIILTNRYLGGKMYPIFEGVEAILAGEKVKTPKKTRLEKQSLDFFRENYHIDYAPYDGN